MLFYAFPRTILLGIVAGSTAATASLQHITTNFGSNPTNVGFYIYIPANVAASPAVMLQCTIALEQHKHTTAALSMLAWQTNTAS